MMSRFPIAVGLVTFGWTAQIAKADSDSNDPVDFSGGFPALPRATLPKFPGTWQQRHAMALAEKKTEVLSAQKKTAAASAAASAQTDKASMRQVLAASREPTTPATADAAAYHAAAAADALLPAHRVEPRVSTEETVPRRLHRGGTEVSEHDRMAFEKVSTAILQALVAWGVKCGVPTWMLAIAILSMPVRMLSMPRWMLSMPGDNAPVAWLVVYFGVFQVLCYFIGVFPFALPLFFFGLNMGLDKVGLSTGLQQIGSFASNFSRLAPEVFGVDPVESVMKFVSDTRGTFTKSAAPVEDTATALGGVPPKYPAKLRGSAGEKPSRKSSKIAKMQDVLQKAGLLDEVLKSTNGSVEADSQVLEQTGEEETPLKPAMAALLSADLKKGGLKLRKAGQTIGCRQGPTKPVSKSGAGGDLLEELQANPLFKKLAAIRDATAPEESESPDTTWDEPEPCSSWRSPDSCQGGMGKTEYSAAAAA
jgi:hypothetical protein